MQLWWRFSWAGIPQIENTSSNEENLQEKHPPPPKPPHPPNLPDRQTETHQKAHPNKTQPKPPTEGVSKLYCTCAGNSRLVIEEMGPCCACPPDTPKELGSLRNQGNTVNRSTHLSKSCYCIQPTQAARPSWACRHLSRACQGNAGNARQGGQCISAHHSPSPSSAPPGSDRNTPAGARHC